MSASSRHRLSPFLVMANVRAPAAAATSSARTTFGELPLPE
jgi:hypothetical protein